MDGDREHSESHPRHDEGWSHGQSVDHQIHRLWQSLQSLHSELKRIGTSIMSKFTDYIDAQEARNSVIDANLGTLTGAVSGVTTDIATLNKMITDLQNSPDRVTQADQDRLDAILTFSGGLVDKTKALADAATALDNLTPAPPAPEPPAVP